MRAYLYPVLLLLISFKSYAQQTLTVQTTDKPIVIDGYLNQEWENTDSTLLSIQLEPIKGGNATRKTIVKSAQDSSGIYFSFQCFINSPEEIVSRIQRRDQLDLSDDMVSVILDTYNDNRTALLFQVNALGTLTDAKLNDDGKTIDYLWDTEWEAKTFISKEYWTVEIRIPFRSIQYRPGKSIWGCNFSRTIKANQEIVWWTSVTENNRVSQNGKLDNIQAGHQKKHSLEFFPYGTLRYENSNITETQDEFKADAGVDIEYKYSSNFKANITVNPDFATVEGDKEQINLTPWELKFPEKRLFFQDGNDMFKTRIQTFYSRRIGDVLYGGKAVGKVGKYQFNGLFAQTKENTDLNVPQAKYTAFKVKRDFLKSSTLGLTYTDKITDTATFHTINFDYVLNLGKTWKLTGQYVASLPGDFDSHSAWFVRFAKENNTYHYHVRFTSLGEDFKDNVNETGFVPDDDRREVDSDISYKFWFNKLLNYLSLSGKNNMFWSQNAVLRSWNFTYGSRAYFRNRLSIDAYYNNEYKLLDKEYYNNYFKTVIGYNTDEASYASLGYRFGDNYNRNFHLIEFKTRFQLFKKLSINYEFLNISFTPDTTFQSTTLNILGLDFYFTKDLWLRFFAQNNVQTEKVYFYGLFGWRFKPPFGAIYLIVNSDAYYNFDTDADIYSEIVFLKFTYPISVIRNKRNKS